MAGSKGPAVMLIRGQAQYRNAYLQAIAFNNWYGALDAILGMAAILPKDAKFTLEMPAEIRTLMFEKMTIEEKDKMKLKAWLTDNKVKVEQAIANYVHKFYKQGGVNTL